MSEEPLIIRSFYSLSEVIRKFLRNKYANKYARNISDELPEELLRPSVFTGIFPLETNKIRTTLNKAFNNLTLIKDKTIENIDKIITDYAEGKQKEYLILGGGVTLPCVFEQLYEELLKLLSPSIAAAIMLQLQLNRLVDEANYSLRLRRIGEAESQTDIVSPLHMAWSLLADKRFSYLRVKEGLEALVEEKEKIRNTFNKILNDEKMFLEIYKSFMEDEQKNLANVLWRWLCERNSELCTEWANYFAGLIFGVKEALERAGFKPGQRILKGYVNICMVNYGFFEYELYSLLVNDGIPAIPKLEVHYRDELQEEVGAGRREKMRELDILAMDSRGRLAQVEVTATDDLSEIQKKIESGPAPIADRLIVVAPEEALNDMNCWDYGAACIPLEKPYRLVIELRGT